jgi:predicted nucleic acid-binding protein
VKPDPVRAWFYDTWGFLALATAADPDHAVAADADRRREEERLTVVTTDYILDETLTALHAVAGPAVALRFLDLFEARVAAESLMLVDVHRLRREGALALFRRFAPKTPRLSLTDCASIVVMAELGLRAAFTTDRHFRLPGGGIHPLFEIRRGRAVWSAGG